jgi:hypothetical protein
MRKEYRKADQVLRLLRKGLPAQLLIEDYAQ